MRVGVLFSGGKDSTLAALLLDPFCDVTVVHAGFGIGDAAAHARETAAAVDFAFERVDLDRGVAEEAVETMVRDGFPRNGIQVVHEHALETVAAAAFDAVADGTRRDDRVPTVSRAWAQSLEDRRDVDYLSPLSGFGRRAVDRLVAETLEVEEAPSERLAKGDYEAELRALVRESAGPHAIEEVFPDHVQTRVVGLRESPDPDSGA